MAQNDEKMPKIFNEVSYFLASKCSEEVEQALKQGGASKEFYMSDLVTHVLSDSCEFDLADEAREYNIPIVRETWVKMCIKSGKKLPTQPFSPKKQLFTGLKICPSKLPTDDLTKLWAMVMYHGGKCQLNLTPSCTHLVIPIANGQKYDKAIQLEGKIKTVTPNWIVDSIKENKLLDEGQYIPNWPEPEQLDGTTTSTEEQDTANEMSVAMETSSSATLKDEEGCEKVKNGTSEKEAEMVSKLPEDDAKVPADSEQKLKDGSKTSESLQTKTKLTSAEPASKPPENVENSLTSVKPADNETKGSPKQLTGTSFSSTSKEDDTSNKDAFEVRETPVKTTGQATDADKLESVSEARHEECVDKDNKVLENGDDTKLTERVDTTMQDVDEEDTSETSSILSGCVFVVVDYPSCMEHSVLNTWIEVIKSNGGELDVFYSERCTHLLCLNQQGKLFSQALQSGKKVVTAHWLNDVLTVKKMSVPSQPLHFPTPFADKLPQCKNLTISVTGYIGLDRLLLKNMIYLIGAKYTGYLSRANTQVICKVPEGDKYVKAKEWGIPCVNAKWLGDIVSSGKVFPCALKKYNIYGESDDLDVNKGFVQALLEPWKNEIAVEESNNQKKRKLIPDEKTEDSEIHSNQSKKQRLSNASTVEVNSNTPHVLFTGLSFSKSTQQLKILEELGGSVAKSPRTCTHLVATKIVRTAKFLSAISVCQFIVTPEWLERSAEAKTFLDPKPFSLRDHDTEKEYKMDLLTSIKRAQSKPLLQDIKVYSTPNVQPTPSSLKEIVEAAGGQFITDIITAPMLSKLTTQKTKEGNPAFVVVTCQEDLKLCNPFIKHSIDIHSTEIILSGVLTQKLDFETYKVKFVK